MIDEKNAASFKAMVNNVKAYCGDDKDMLDYVKLCKLLEEDIQKQEEKIRFEQEQVMATQSAIMAQSESKINLLQDQKDKPQGASPSPAGGQAAPTPASDMSLRQQIVAHYSKIKFTKEQILKRLVPNDSFASLSNLEKTIRSDIKEIPQADLLAFIKSIAGEKPEVTKVQLKDALFQETKINKDSKEITIDDHIDMVFHEIDLEQKNALTKYQLALGCKYLGLNLSEGEIEKMFRQYKHPDAAFMDLKGFSKLVKYQYFKDISKDKIVQDRLEKVLRSIDHKGSRYINEAQLRAIFSSINRIPNDQEIKAIFIECDPRKSDNGDNIISVDKLSGMVCRVSPALEKNNEDLINGLIKIRSGLDLTVADQFKGFKDMPLNYVVSFSDDLFTHSNQHLPTSVFRPLLSDTKSYYLNLFSPSTASEAILSNKIPKFLRPSRQSVLYEITLEKATGVPIPDDSLVKTSEIVGREVRVMLFEDNKNTFVGNCLNLECQWKFEYEDRFYFETNDIAKENVVYVKLPELELNSREKKYLAVFELVNFVRKEKTNVTLAMTAGYAKFVLTEVASEKSLSLEITGGSPAREKTVPINPDDVRHKRRGFFPKLVSIFEGKIKSQLAVNVKPLKLNLAKLSEHEEELELLPDLGVFHYNQVKIQACYRQCLGRDAFSVSGTVASSINRGLPSEIYVNSFCSLFCMPTCAVILSHFWNNNVATVYEKEPYDLKMDILKMLFMQVYPTLNSMNFRFQKHYPTDQLYGQDEHQQERKRLLKRVLEDAWIKIFEAFPTKKAVQPKFIENLKHVSDQAIVTQHSSFNIQELMDDDFDIQIY